MTNEDGLRLIAAYGAALTKRQRAVLCMMADAHRREDWSKAEFVYENGEGYVGLERVSERTLFALIRACAITRELGDRDAFEVWTINETGPALVDSWAKGAA